MKNLLKSLFLLVALLPISYNLIAQNNEVSFETFFEVPLDEQKNYFNTSISPTIGYSNLDTYKRKTNIWSVKLGFSKASPLADTVRLTINSKTERRVYEPLKSINLNFGLGGEYELSTRISLTYTVPVSFRYVHLEYTLINNNYVEEDVTTEFRVALIPHLGLKFRVFHQLYLGMEAFYLLSATDTGGYDENTFNSSIGFLPTLSVKF